MFDFTKAKIGQKVTCYIYGKGIIKSLNYNNFYPVSVKLDKGGYQSYMLDGRFDTEGRPTLVIGHVDFPPLDQGKLPKVPKPLEWKGDIVWAYVSNTGDYEESIKHGEQQVIQYQDNRYLSIENSKTIHDIGITILYWEYAWEVENV